MPHYVTFFVINPKLIDSERGICYIYKYILYHRHSGKRTSTIISSWWELFNQSATDFDGIYSLFPIDAVLMIDTPWLPHLRESIKEHDGVNWIESIYELHSTNEEKKTKYKYKLKLGNLFPITWNGCLLLNCRHWFHWPLLAYASLHSKVRSVSNGRALNFY